MKRIALSVLCAAALSCGQLALADKGGSCHFHGASPAKQETILVCAVQRKDALVASGKIDASWKGVKHEKLEQVDGKKGKEWKVTFRNPAVAEKGKQALFVFLSMPGNVLAANFSGR